MADSTEDEFIVQGIARYAQALETIDVFQTMMRDRLRDILKSYSCQVFTPSPAEISTGLSDGAHGHLVWANNRAGASKADQFRSVSAAAC